MSTLLVHDVAPGVVDRCHISGSTDLFEAIDLGHQPPAGSLLSESGLREPETHYPLRLMVCPESGLGQLDYVVDREILFPVEYPYRPGISEPLKMHLGALADEIVDAFAIPERSLCVDIGSNDGTLLAAFSRRNMYVLGVEPTNMGEVARRENRVPTIQAFFRESVAADIVAEHGRAKVITMTNVFAHIASLGEVMLGLTRLLDRDGVFVTESQYLLDVLERNQFDEVYHDHVRIYSVKSVMRLMSQFGLEVFDARAIRSRDGTVRTYIGWAGRHPIRPAVAALVEAEERRGLFTPQAWRAFALRVDECRDRCLELAYAARRSGQRVVADSCPARGIVLLNYYGLDQRLLPYIGQIPGTEKVGKYAPGVRVPIVSSDRILAEQPDYVIVLAWHFSDFIIEKWRARGLRSKFVIPLPTFTVV